MPASAPSLVPVEVPPHRRLRWWLAAGAGLALAAVAVRLQSDAAERRHPPEGRFLVVQGVRLHFRDWGGSGPPLVLLHGNGAMAQDFEISGLVELARAHWRVIAFDRPGFGWSERPRGTRWTPQAQADLLQQAMALLGLPPAVVLGHSWGAQVALALGLQHPQAVRALVLASGYWFATPRPDLLLAALPALPGPGTLLRHTLSPLLGRLLWSPLVRQLFAPRPVTPAFAQRFPRGLALRPSQLRASAAESALLLPGARSLGHAWQGLQVPAVVTVGDGDRLVDPQAQSLRLQRELPGSVLHLSRGSGHMLHHTAPQDVLAAIEAAAGLADRREAGLPGGVAAGQAAVAAP